MSISVKKYCMSCNKKCEKCDGKGIIHQVKNLGIFQQVFASSCENCNSSGTVLNVVKSCKECNGTQICPHNYIKYICPHNSIKYRCKECN